MFPMVFGHASRDRLEDVWQQSKVLCDLRQGLPDRLEGICSACLMRAQCLGACVAQNYYRSKSLYAANWYCEKAIEKGLFPNSRLAAPAHGIS